MTSELLKTGGFAVLATAVTVLVTGYRNVLSFFSSLQRLLVVEEVYLDYANRMAMVKLVERTRIKHNLATKVFRNFFVHHKNTGRSCQVVFLETPATGWCRVGWRLFRYEMSGRHVTVRYLRGMVVPSFFVKACAAEIARAAAEFEAHFAERSEARCGHSRHIVVTGTRDQVTMQTAANKHGTPFLDPVNTPTPGQPAGGATEKTNSFYDGVSTEQAFITGDFQLVSKDEISALLPLRKGRQTYFMSPVMQTAANELKTWLSLQGWYSDRGIDWKRAWALCGPPGTGKSSLVRVLARENFMDVLAVDLTTMTNEDLYDFWTRRLLNEFRTPCFVLFEDLDGVFDGRTNITNVTELISQPIHRAIHNQSRNIFIILTERVH